MMTKSENDMQEDRGYGSRLFMCRRDRAGSVNRGNMAAQIVPIQVAASQEKSLGERHYSVSFTKWPTTFVGGSPYGKSRPKQ